MKRLLNTLYVTTQGAYLHRDGETVAVRVDHETKMRVPIHMLGGVMCFGQVSCSPPLMGLCGERGVGLAFLSEHGRFLARVEGPASGNVLLRRAQYRAADDGECTASIAANAVAAKLANCRAILLRAVRDRNPEAEAIDEAATRLDRLIGKVGNADDVDTVRGIEGDGARAYFGVFDHLITAQKDAFFFHERSRRPPRDNMNSLLSFLYVLLEHDVASALESVGLDSAVGYLHRDRPGRRGLALDLMEELRPVLADRLALSLVNRRQVKAKGFVTAETGAPRMDDKTRKTVIVAYQERKQHSLRHPYIDEAVSLGLLPHVQAQLLARHLRGDIEAYPPFFYK